MQGGKVSQLVNKFNNAVETPDQSKLVQISSDGPSVNVKFLNIMNSMTKEIICLLLILELVAYIEFMELKALNFFFRVEN